MHILSGSRLCTILSHGDDLIPAAPELLRETWESWNSRIPNCFPFLPGNISTSVFFYLPFPLCLRGQKSLFESIQFSAALISKSQVETFPAEGLLASLSHSSLTHKQLVTRAAIFFSPARQSCLHQCNHTHAKLIFLIILMQIDKLASLTNRANLLRHQSPQSVFWTTKVLLPI